MGYLSVMTERKEERKIQNQKQNETVHVQRLCLKKNTNPIRISIYLGQ